MASPLSLYVSAYPGCAAELMEFRNRNREFERDRTYFDWRYLGRPCVARPLVVWAEKDGERVGALTVFPHDYHVLDGEYPIGILGDVSVLEEHRGIGIAAAMLRFLAEVEAVRRLRGCLVLPNAAAARSFRKAGWRQTDRIERFAKQLDFRFRLPIWLRHSALASAAAAPLNSLTRAISYEAFYRTRHYQAEVLRQIDERFDRLWQRADKGGKVLAVRDARYLRWRYQDHPVNAYRMLAITETGTLCGYAMYRMVGDVCHVDDMFCLDPRRHAIHVLGFLLRRLREEENASSVSVNINRSVCNFPWRRFGFMRRPDYQEVMTTVYSPAHAPLSATSGAGWHIMAGDKDV